MVEDIRFKALEEQLKKQETILQEAMDNMQ